MRELVARLRAFEQAQDQAFTLGGQLAASLAAAQAEQRLAGGVTQPVFQAVGEALGHLAASRGSVLAGHRSLEKIARVFGIDFTMDDSEFGDSRKYPPGVTGGAAAQPPLAA